MNDSVDTIEKDGYTAELHYDSDTMSPKDWGQLGTLVTWHRRWCPDEDGQKRFGEPAEFLRQAKAGRWVVLPISMYEHSGITIWVGKGPHAFDQQGWDSGQVGFIYGTKARFAEVIDSNLNRWRVRAEKVLRSEVETWDQYIRGDVYGVVVKGPEGEERESCWGLYGYDYAEEEMKRMLDAAIERDRTEEEKIQRVMAL